MKRNKFLFGFTLVAMLFVLVLCIDRASVKAADAAYGDVDANASVNVKDLVLLEKLIGGVETTNTTNSTNANINRDSATTDSKDAISLRRELAGIENVSVDVSSETSGSGTAKLVTSTIGSQYNASYLKTGEYTNECFEFTTTFTGSGNLYIGARRTNVGTDVKSGTGIVMMVNSTSIAYYSRYVTGTQQIGTLTISELTPGNEYTFRVWVEGSTTAGTNDLVVHIAEGDTVLGTYRHSECKNLTANKGNIDGQYVPDKGAFAVWNLNEECTIDYVIPYKAATQSYVVDASDTDGTITLLDGLAGNTLTYKNALYLQMNGIYETECFEFTKEYVGTDFFIGARMATMNKDVRASQGLAIQIKETTDTGKMWIQTYYANGSKINTKGKILPDFEMEDNVTYRFKLWVFDGTTDGTSNYIIQIGKENADGKTTWLGTYDYENDSNIASNASYPLTELADSGSFAVWAYDGTSARISYKIPTAESALVSSKVVNSTDADAETQGNVNLYRADAALYGTATYLQMAGEYTNECFEFTTAFRGDGDLHIGARVTSVGETIKPGSGIILRINKNSIPYYTANVTGTWQIGTIPLGEVLLEEGEEYTFIVQVTGSTTAQNNDLVVTIKEGDTVLGTYKHSTDATLSGKVHGNINYTDYVPDKGSFAVWSAKPACSITYKIPYGEVVAYYARQE